MKSLIASCAILAVVITVIVLHGEFVHDCTQHLMLAVQSLPQNTNGDPTDYETAMQNLYLILKENRARLAVTVPGRITEPMERSLRSIEAGWLCDDNALYRQSVEEALLAIQRIRDTEGFSLTAVL